MHVNIPILSAFLTISSLLSQAQTVSPSHVDSSTLAYSLSHGSIQGSARYFFMATDNRAGLTDYYAQAIGAGFRYETKKWKGWQIGMGGFFHTEISSSGLDKIDPLSGSANRMEIGLFDVRHPGDRHALARLEELYLHWSQGSWESRIGKQFIQTPFLNLQDGRMRPSAVEGWRIRKHLQQDAHIDLAWYWKMSPRGTTDWYSVASSIGVYPSGVNENGSKSQYAGHLSSLGNFLLSAGGRLGRFGKWQLWDLLTENILHTAMIQVDHTCKQPKEKYWLLSAQFIRQDAVHDGGNTDPEKAYASKGSKAWAFSGKSGWGNKHWEHSIQYTRITADGRCLMPREWGRDPFYTFLARERNEGFGDVHAVMLMSAYKLPRNGIQFSLGLGYYDLPGVKNYRLNKYGMPSYYQLNTDLRYHFHGQLNGFDLQFLLAAKKHAGHLPDQWKYVISKVDMLNWNLVLNYGF